MTDGRPRWAVVQHVAYEGPGLIAVEAERRGVALDVARMDLGAPLTAELAGSMADHLPGDVALPEDERAEMERAGRQVVAAFFDAALALASP